MPYMLVYFAGDNGVRRRYLWARHRASARGVHVRGPAAVGRAAPRGLPHAVLRAHAAHAEGDGGARRYATAPIPASLFCK